MKRLLQVLASVAFLLMAPLTASAEILDGAHQIVNRDWQLCLDVHNAGVGDGVEVRAWHCVNANNQRWTKVPVVGGFQLQVAHSGKCLRVQWQGDGYWSNLVQDPCSVATVWVIEDGADGWSRITTTRPPDTGAPLKMCLEKYGWDAMIWDCNGRKWQDWQSLG